MEDGGVVVPPRAERDEVADCLGGVRGVELEGYRALGWLAWEEGGIGGEEWKGEGRAYH